MLWRDDPLSEWMEYPGSQWEGDLHSAVRRPVVTFSDFMDRLDRELDKSGKIDLYSVQMPNWWMPMPKSDLRRAEALYKRMAQRGGGGTTMYQQAMLQWIALAQDESTIPFWQEMLDLRIPRDRMRYGRWLRATAALAFLVATLDSNAALEALLDAAHHHEKEIRALAIYHLGRAYEDEEEFREVPDQVVRELTNIATTDPDFEPRYQARVILRMISSAPILDNPGSVYVFKVKYALDRRIYRTIELRAEQTLEHLHLAITKVLGWEDDEYPYEFFVNGELYDGRYSFGGPVDTYSGITADVAVLGELGLVVGQKIAYVCGPQDEHVFEIDVLGNRPNAKGRYPKLIDSYGALPPQFSDEDYGNDWPVSAGERRQ